MWEIINTYSLKFICINMSNNSTNYADENVNILKTIPEEFQEKNYLEIGVRPWGVYYVLEDKPNYKVKKIVVNPGNRLSLQSHQHRSEHWVIVSGTASIEIRKEDDPKTWTQTLLPNQSCYIPATKMHRLGNYGKVPLILIEVQAGEYTGEDDIERFEDDYSRVAK
jgi:mannose-6-phosphate isomerase-like protein (cupin superfamily)